MFWLGLILPVCFVAGITGATIPTQWPLLSIALVPVLWRDGPVTWMHWCGVAFLIYATASVAWSPHPVFAVWGLWGAMLWALAFWLGSTSVSLLPLWRGLAIGLSISSAVAIAQAIGWTSLPSEDVRDGGLLYNPAVQGAMIALVIIALICERQWRYIPAMLPGLWLAHSRGAWLVLGIGLMAKYLHWSFMPVAIAVVGAAAMDAMGPSDTIRLLAWSAALHGLALFGFGVGSFGQLIYQDAAGAVIRPEYAHNDYLQLAFEFGIGAIPAYAIVAAALSRTADAQWPTFAAFCTCSLFFFPLYAQPLAFVGAVIAGHLVRRPDRDGVVGVISRSDFMARLPATRAIYATAWRGAVSIPSRDPAQTIGAINAPI